MTHLRGKLVRWGLFVTGLLGAHLALEAWLAGGTIVSALLSPGAHTPFFELLVAVAFLLSRIVVLVVLPAAAAGALAWAVATPLVRMLRAPRAVSRPRRA